MLVDKITKDLLLVRGEYKAVQIELATRPSIIKRNKLERLSEHKNLLSTLLGDVQRIGFDDGKRSTTDSETVQIVKKFIQNNKFTIKEIYRVDGAGEFYNKLNEISQKRVMLMKQEIDYVTCYMPAQLSVDEATSIICKYINLNPDAKLGVIMKHMKGKYDGRYDGKDIVDIIKMQLK